MKGILYFDIITRVIYIIVRWWEFDCKVIQPMSSLLKCQNNCCVIKTSCSGLCTWPIAFLPLPEFVFVLVVILCVSKVTGTQEVVEFLQNFEAIWWETLTRILLSWVSIHVYKINTEYFLLYKVSVIHWLWTLNC